VKEMRKSRLIPLFGGLFTGTLSFTTVWADTNPLQGLTPPSSGASSGPGVALYQQIQPQLVPIFVLILGVIAVWYLLRHQHTKLVSWIIGGIIVGVLVLEPTALGGMIDWVGSLFKAL
jgi:mannose/fructose/N-acetylgalactosamine-specific phosphotransferase system component IID